jgi:tetratricopeptide (TPR) repeat protein
MNALPALLASAALLLGGCASTSTSTTSTTASAPRKAAAAADTASAAAALARGDAAWRSGRPEEALRAYLDSAQLDPADDAALLRIGMLQEVVGRLDLAVRALQLAERRDPRKGLTAQRLGFLWLQLGRDERAAQDFTRALQLDPALWASCMGLGLAAEQRGDAAAARLHYDEALALRPESPELLAYSARADVALGRLAQAREQAGRSFAAAPSTVARLALGDVMARERDYAGALEAYHPALELAPAYQRLGEQAMAGGDLDAAVGFFESATRASPVHSEQAHQRLAVARERLAAEARAAARAPGRPR